MKRVLLPLLLVPGIAAAGDRIIPNRDPLQPTPFISLDLGSVKARGWLERQLRLQADGLTGHAEQVIPELGPDSGWRGGKGESWEKGPYYLRGLTSLAYVLDDPVLKERAQVWIDALLASQRDSGQIGPGSNGDWWPRMVMTWVLRDYHEATGDKRVIPALEKYAGYLLERLPGQPLEEWAKARSGDQIDTLYWLYNRTGDESLLEAVDWLRDQSNRWKPFYRTLRGDSGDFRIVHGVNVSQGMKYPVVTWERTGKDDDRRVFADAWASLRQRHGLPFGMWSGTEPLAGKSTTQGVEMCSIVEQMLSSEVALGALGDPLIGDQLERIAFNLLPGGTTKDFRQFQYYTLPNAPVARRNERGTLPFRDDHGDDLLVSPHSGFHCCCYNLHMGWPKYVQHAWMATSDGGLAAVAYGPTEVTAKLGDVPVTITEETDYPFTDTIRFTVKPGKPAAFPLKLRIPAWAVAPRVAVNGEFVPGVQAGAFFTLQRTWTAGDVVTAEFPADIETSNGFNGSAAVWRGPLVFSLRIGEKRETVTTIDGGFDEFELIPTTPWNYALDIDRGKAGGSVELHRAKMPANPWLPDTTPISLSVPAKRLPGWGLVRNDRMAAEVPASPVASDQPVEKVTLVPFGAQTLRITAFPLLRGEAVPEPGLTASHQHDSIDAMIENDEPTSSKGEGLPRFTFWDHTGSEEWIQWTFDKPAEVSASSLYWFDDTGSGMCRVPESWKLLYRRDGRWLPVADPSGYGVATDQANTVKFTPVTTDALRVEIRLQKDFSGGVLRWTKE
ncbi:beta-L-arabinofuranosidase domain-containing protein [Luteolibacter marinus]|uniref:beta-L-arabinofuranosidase domain-containing protein n=1 Tax=Luteolibacter marinus TaxID=2776705 RepID=UPI001867A3EC|nr:beta-L-arabinofuranosidase domain-containing protein [Luteolibacter marinus]